MLATAVLAFSGLNVVKSGIYKEYYLIKTVICNKQGLSDGFVCQGIAADEENRVFPALVYIKDKSASDKYKYGKLLFANNIYGLNYKRQEFCNTGRY